jgi:hypothetical protein
MSDYKDLEFLSERARELLDRQITSFRANHAKAGTIIAIITIFIPIFLYIIEKASYFIQLLAIIPLLILGYALYLMIKILKTEKLDQGFDVTQFDKLINEKYERILLYEIGAKKYSFIDNQLITEKQNKRFEKGLNTTIIAIILSFTILISNVFYESIKPNSMNNSNSNCSKKEQKEKPAPPQEPQKTQERTIPFVPKQERTQLNEGSDPKIGKKSNSD